MIQILDELFITKVAPPIYRRVQEFLIKVLSYSLSLLIFLLLIPCFRFSWFDVQVGAGRTRPNIIKKKAHSGLDLIFADVPENLIVLVISTSSRDIPSWNMCSKTCFDGCSDLVDQYSSGLHLICV